MEAADAQNKEHLLVAILYFYNTFPIWMQDDLQRHAHTLHQRK
jgi:hypothetical protein